MMNIKVKNAMVIAVSSLFALASCGEVNEGMKNKMVTADFGVASMTVSATTGNGDENVTKGAKYTRPTDATVYASPEKVRLAGTNAFASFFARIDGAIPDEEVDNGNNWIPQNSALYYPKAENGHGTYVINRQVDATKMGHNLFVVDRYGKTVKDCLLDEPTMDDMKVYFAGHVLTYHDTVIYDQSNGIDLLDNYKIIWYVIKYQGGRDNIIHVDGAIVPNSAVSVLVGEDEKDELGGENDQTDETYNEQDYQDIVVNVDVDADLLIQFDDFDIRHSGQDGYVYYQRNINANSLTYNELTLSRDEHLNVHVNGLNKLDWSGENTVWTFETWMWAENLPQEQYPAWKQEKNGTIDDNLFYNIKYQTYQGFQSNGTVPYIKVSIHVTKK